MRRNKFNLSYTRLFSCDMGELIPCGLMEVLPGDSIQMSTSALIRCAPMLAPPMHPVHVRIHHWFVPHRLVWPDFEKFITGGPDGLDATTWPFTTQGAGSTVPGTLFDYLGLPTFPAGGLSVSTLPIQGYQMIWNEWYRDQDLQTAATLDLGNGGRSPTVTLQNVAWEKDYFTSARPWEQKGAAVTIPLLGTAPVTGSVLVFEGAATRQLERAGGGTGANVIVNEAGGAGGTDLNLNMPAGTANLAAASGVTINALRQSLALQRFEEARARYGSRYTEYLRSLGVRSSDARLQLPEYLGGGRQTIQFSEVLQTGGDGSNPVSTLRGHGISAMRSNRFRRFFEEHGFIHTLMSVRPKTIYQDGVPRHWSRTTKFDYWQKELESIGQQAIKNKEIYAVHATPEGTFGYQDRYDEYRRAESGVAGEFRTSALNFWHFSRIFGSTPALNSTFVSAVPPERPFAAPASDVLYIHARHSIQARRMLSKVATPRTF